MHLNSKIYTLSPLIHQTHPTKLTLPPFPVDLFREILDVLLVALTQESVLNKAIFGTIGFQVTPNTDEMDELSSGWEHCYSYFRRQIVDQIY